jgi:hypothetical protein
LLVFAVVADELVSTAVCHFGFPKGWVIYCYGAGVLLFIFWHKQWLVSFGSCSTLACLVAAVVFVTVILVVVVVSVLLKLASLCSRFCFSDCRGYFASFLALFVLLCWILVS